jgi:hypothetical protein
MLTLVHDGEISKEEILKCVKSLKNDKACADFIINEYIKSTCNQLLDIYVKLFNIIFKCGLIPESWILGTIKYPYRKPHWHSLSNKNSSEKSVSLLHKMAVNNFPKQLTIACNFLDHTYSLYFYKKVWNMYRIIFNMYNNIKSC